MHFFSELDLGVQNCGLLILLKGKFVYVAPIQNHQRPHAHKKINGPSHPPDLLIDCRIGRHLPTNYDGVSRHIYPYLPNEFPSVLCMH